MSSPCSVTYDENSGKVVFLMEKDSDSSRIYSRVGTISGNDLTLGTEVRVDDTNGSAQDSQDVTIVYAPTKQQVYASYTVNDGGTRKARSKFGTVSGNSITWSSSAYNFKNPDGNVVRYLHTVAADSSMQAGIIMHTWKWNNDDYGYAKQIDFASVVSNLTNANQYVGYPDQQYTDAQTATIKTLGNNVSLSGLSTSSDYYVQQDGSLATTKDTVEVYAGRALSDNKFLINLPVPPTLGWEVVSSHVLDGSTQNYDFTGWSNRYAEYQVILDNVYNSSGFKIWIQVYTDATSGNDGTLQTSANYGYGAPYARADTMVNQVQGNGYWGKNQHILGTNQGTRTYWSGYQTFPMKTSNYSPGRMIWNGNTRGNYEHMYVTESGWFQPPDTSHHITGIRMGFWNNGGSSQMTPSGGRVTLMRLKVA